MLYTSHNYIQHNQLYGYSIVSYGIKMNQIFINNLTLKLIK